jgi:hypothetical protein
MLHLRAWLKLTCPIPSPPGETATTGATEAIEVIPATEAAAAEGPVLPTTAAADPVAKTAMSTPILPAETTATASAKIATQGATVGEATGAIGAIGGTAVTGARGNGTGTAAPGLGETMATGATAARTVI